MTEPMTRYAAAAGSLCRVKLALSYAGFLVVAGVALFVVGFLLLRFVPEGTVRAGGRPGAEPLQPRRGVRPLRVVGPGAAARLRPGRRLVARRCRAATPRSHHGRRTPGRRWPLDHRISLPGRHDELTDLADAFDAMLARVQRALDEERRFAANASHELRTPHAIIRTMVEVAAGRPGGADVDTLLQRVESPTTAPSRRPRRC